VKGVELEEEKDEQEKEERRMEESRFSLLLPLSLTPSLTVNSNLSIFRSPSPELVGFLELQVQELAALVKWIPV